MKTPTTEEQAEIDRVTETLAQKKRERETAEQAEKALSVHLDDITRRAYGN